MKYLLQCCDDATVVGINTHAYLIWNGSIHELKREALSSVNINDSVEEEEKQDNNDPNDIQCVAISKDTHNTIWCAVSRYNKTLEIYKNSTFQLVHTTAKRSSCLTFAWCKELGGCGMVISGDLVGDATAFPLEGVRKGRLLLGHTASMLTGVRLAVGASNTMLLTADRDEKVRVSSFPQTCIIHGFLLGHSAFVSSVDTAKDDCCVTCGGDFTVRLWDLHTLEELHQVQTGGLLPVQLSTDGERVAVIFHQSNLIHVYSMKDLCLLSTLELSTQPLAVVLRKADMVLLAKEPTLLQLYQLEENEGIYKMVDSKEFSKLNEQCKDETLRSSILETDCVTGQLKLGKTQESRTVNPADIPWHRVERIQKARESRNRRSKRRKAES